MGAVWVLCGGLWWIHGEHHRRRGWAAISSSLQEGFGLHNSDEQQPKSTGKPTNPTNRPRFIYVGKKDSKPKGPPHRLQLPFQPQMEKKNRYRGIRKGRAITCRDVSSKRGNGGGA
jgi:hypothetical protein